MKTRYELFLDAYADVPSQDNEGYVPERGAFKCGFEAGFDAGYMRAVELLRSREPYASLSFRWDRRTASEQFADWLERYSPITARN